MAYNRYKRSNKETSNRNLTALDTIRYKRDKGIKLGESEELSPLDKIRIKRNQGIALSKEAVRTDFEENSLTEIDRTNRHRAAELAIELARKNRNNASSNSNATNIQQPTAGNNRVTENKPKEQTQSISQPTVSATNTKQKSKPLNDYFNDFISSVDANKNKENDKDKTGLGGFTMPKAGDERVTEQSSDPVKNFMDKNPVPEGYVPEETTEPKKNAFQKWLEGGEKSITEEQSYAHAAEVTKPYINDKHLVELMDRYVEGSDTIEYNDIMSALSAGMNGGSDLGITLINVHEINEKDKAFNEFMAATGLSRKEASKVIENYTWLKHYKENEKEVARLKEASAPELAINTLVNIGAAPTARLLQGIGALGNAGDPELGKDYNSPIFVPANFSRNTKEAVHEDIDSAIDKDKHKVLNYIANKAYDVPVMAGESLASLMVGKVGLLTFGTGGYAENLREAENRGLTKRQAQSYAFVMGAAEIATESIPFNNLGRLITKGASKETLKGSLKPFAKELAKQMLEEGGEEVANDVIDIYADRLINGDKSKLNIKIQNYMSDGLSEEDAKAKAYQEEFVQVLDDLVSGSLSGGLSAGGVLTGQAASETKTGRDISKDTEYIDAALNNKESADYISEEESDYASKEEYEQAQHTRELLQSASDAVAEGGKLAGKKARELYENVSKAQENRIENAATRAEETAISNIQSTSTPLELETVAEQLKVDNENINKAIEVKKAELISQGAKESDFSEALTPSRVVEKAIKGEEISSEALKNLPEQTQIAYEFGKIMHEQTIGKDISKADATDVWVEDAKQKRQQINKVKFNTKGELTFVTNTGKEVNAYDAKYSNEGEKLYKSENGILSLSDPSLIQIAIDAEAESNHSYPVASLTQAIKTFDTLGRTQGVDFETALSGKKYMESIVGREVLEQAFNAHRDTAASFDEGKKTGAVKAGRGIIATRTEENANEYDAQFDNADITEFINKENNNRKSLDPTNYEKIKNDVEEAKKAFEDMTEAQKLFLEAFSKKAKVDFDFIYSKNGDTRGAYRPEKSKILLNLAYGKDIFEVALHEGIGEFLQAHNAAGYNAITDSILNYYASTQTDDLAENIRAYQRAYGNRHYRESFNELANDAMGRIFSTDEGLTELINWLDINETTEQAKTVKKTFMDYFNAFKDMISNILKQGGLKNQHIKDLKIARQEAADYAKQLLEAMDVAIENRDAAVGQQGENAPRLSKNIDYTINSANEIVDKNGNIYAFISEKTFKANYINKHKRAVKNIVKAELAKLVRPEPYIIKSTGQEVYVENDFAGEFVDSKDMNIYHDSAPKIKLNIHVKAQELIENAWPENGKTPVYKVNTEAKHKIDAKRGWNYYITGVALKTEDGIAIYNAVLNIRLDASGKDCVYDITEINKVTSFQPESVDSYSSSPVTNIVTSGTNNTTNNLSKSDEVSVNNARNSKIVAGYEVDEDLNVQAHNENLNQEEQTQTLAVQQNKLVLRNPKYIQNTTWSQIAKEFKKLGYTDITNGNIAKQTFTRLIENSPYGYYIFNDDQAQAIEKIFGLNTKDMQQDKTVSPEKASNIAKKAEKQFGTTNNFKLAGYLDVNGKLLDFSEGQGYRVQDHREISEILELPEDADYSDGLIEFMAEGNIRLQEYGIDIAVKPNSKQRSVLRDFFNSLDGEVTVDFSNVNGDSIGSAEYVQGTASTRILNDIDNYFDGGDVPEGNIDSINSFRYSRKIDTEYDAAYKANDTEKMQQLVEQAARAAGFDSPMLYHGTSSFGFTSFDLDKMDDTQTIFLTSNNNIASTYSGTTKNKTISEKFGDIDSIPNHKLADALNSVLPDDGTERHYEYFNQKDIKALRDKSLSGIKDVFKSLDNLLETTKEEKALKAIKRMREIQMLFSAEDILNKESVNKDFSTMLFMATHHTETFKNNTSWKDLEQLIRKSYALTHDVNNNEKEFIVDNYLDGYLFDVWTPKEARVDLKENVSKGNYSLYAKLGDSLVIDAEGKNWNELRNWSKSYTAQFNKKNTLLERYESMIYLMDANGEILRDMKENDVTKEMSDDTLHQHMLNSLDAIYAIRAERLVTTRDIVKFAKNHGYDSVVFKNIRDNGGRNYKIDYNELADVYALFNPNNIKSADPVTYDDDGKIIPLSERFNTTKNELRYSKAVFGESSQYAQTLQQSEYVSKILSTLNNQLKGTTVSMRYIDDTVKYILDKYKANLNADELKMELSEFIGYMTANENVDYNQMMNYLMNIGDEVIEASELKDPESERVYNELKNELASHKLNLTEVERKELIAKYGGDWQVVFGKLNSIGIKLDTKNGQHMDAGLFSEISEQFRTIAGVYLDESTTPVDQVATIIDAMDALTPSNYGWEGANNMDKALDVAMTIIDRYYSMASSIKESNIVKGTEKGSAAIERAKQAEIKDLRAKQAEWKAKLNEEFQSLVEDKKKMIQEQQEFYRRQAEIERKFKGEQREFNKKVNMSSKEIEKTAKMQAQIAYQGLKDTEAKRKHKDNIVRTCTRLINWMNKPTDARHVPSFLKPALSDMIKSINFMPASMRKGNDGTISAMKWQEAMRKLQNVIQSIEKADSENLNDADKYQLALVMESEEIVAKMQRLLDKYSGTADISLMSNEDLKVLSNIMSSISNSISKMNANFMNKRFAHVSEAATAAIDEMSELRPVANNTTKFKDNAQDFLNLSMAEPITFFEELGDASSSIMQEFYDGEKIGIDIIREAEEFFNNLSNQLGLKTKDIRKWEKDIRSFNIDNHELKLTIADIMSLYCSYHREKLDQQNRPFEATHHISAGGIKAYKQSVGTRKVLNKNAQVVHPTEGQVMDIINSLSETQKQYADAVVKYMSTTLAAHGNETSNKLNGYSKYLGDYYFPLKTDANTHATTEANNATNQASLRNVIFPSLSKSQIDKADNALVVMNFFDVVTEHITDMSNYCAYSMPVSDALRWYNYSVTERNNTDVENEYQRYTTTLKDAITRVHGDGAKKYFETFIRDVNLNPVNQGDDKAQIIVQKLTGLAKAKAVGLNIRVIVQQPCAIIRAENVIEKKYLVKGWLKMTGGTRIGINEDFKAIPIINKQVEYAQSKSYLCYWKSKGLSDTRISQGMKEIITGQDTVIHGIVEATGYLAGAADDITWCAMYLAAEEKVKATTDLQYGTAEFDAAVEEIFSDIINHTQVIDSQLRKTATMRSKDWGSVLMNAFKKEPQKTYNMLHRAKWNQIQAKYSQDKVKIKAANKAWAKTFAIFIENAFVTAIAQSLVDAWRDDEDEEYWLKILQKMFPYESKAAIDEFVKELSKPEKDRKSLIKLSWKLMQGVLAGTGNILENADILSAMPGVSDIISGLKGYQVQRLDDTALLSQINDTIQQTGSSTATPYSIVYSLSKAIGYFTGIGADNALRDLRGIYNEFFSDTTGYRIEKSTKDAKKREKAKKAKELSASFDSGSLGDVIDVMNQIHDDAIESGKDQSESWGAVRDSLKEEYINQANQGKESQAAIDNRFKTLLKKTKYDKGSRYMTDKEIDNAIKKWHKAIGIEE